MFIKSLYSYLVPPNITEVPENVFAIAGDNITLRCKGFGDPILKVQWIKNDLKIDPGYERSIKVENGYNILRIINVGLVDAGKYRCQFSNYFATNTTPNAQLSVQG